MPAVSSGTVWTGRRTALTIRIRHRAADLTFLNAITKFGTAFDLTLEEIAIETYLPADATTMDYFRRARRRSP
jgi:hypothetical protein